MARSRVIFESLLNLNLLFEYLGEIKSSILATPPPFGAGKKFLVFVVLILPWPRSVDQTIFHSFLSAYSKFQNNYTVLTVLESSS